ncbi:unnamed protein product [Meganyctiphanes norvegica]|uniref:Uncharacterized protein n=1 Tax=Meganyctiphanes norvegica TaxID=48144 RepID=A0AAV2R8S3_MEGNR
MHLSAYKGIEWWTILLILFVVKDSHETSNEDLAEAIQQLTILVDTKLIQLDSNMNIMNTRFESEINKMNTRFESQERHYTEDKIVKEKISEDLETVKSKVIILEGHFYYVKLLQEQYYIENRAVNKQNTEDLQGLKDKVISLEGNLNVIKDIHTNSYEEINERGLSFDTNVNEIKVMSNETTELLSIINVSLNEEVLDLKQDLALLTDTINEIKTLTNNTSEEIKLLQEERTSCNSAFNNLTSISNEIFKKLATIDTKIIEMDNITDDSANESYQLIFHHNEITVYSGFKVNLDCGVVGDYQWCHWEHDNLIYKLGDISSGAHSKLKLASNSTGIQCGITIT